MTKATMCRKQNYQSDPQTPLQHPQHDLHPSDRIQTNYSHPKSKKIQVQLNPLLH